MGVVINRGAAGIHADGVVAGGGERFYVQSQGVIKTQSHRMSEGFSLACSDEYGASGTEPIFLSISQINSGIPLVLVLGLWCYGNRSVTGSR